MATTSSRLACAFCCIASAIGWSTCEAQEPAYTWVDLPTAGMLGGEAYRINDNGQSVGTLLVSAGDYGRHAVVYDGDTLVDLALVPSQGLDGRVPAYAQAINSHGDVVGGACGPDGAHDCYAFLYKDGQIVSIHPHASYITSVGTGINDSGEIVGIQCQYESDCQGFIYKDGTYTFLEDSPEGEINPWGINNSGVVSGWHGYRYSFIYDHGDFINLGPSCGEANRFMDGAINENGHVASNMFCRPYLYINTRFEDLGDIYGVSYGINDAADVVGHDLWEDTSWLYSHTRRTLYYLDDYIKNPVEGRRFVVARDINNAGQIVGYGCDTSGWCRGVRLDPVVPPPELLSLTLKSSVIPGCRSMSGTVTLPAPAQFGGVVVALSDTLAAVGTPATLKIPEGVSTKSFTVKTIAVASEQAGNVSASLGKTTLTADLTVRPMGMTSLALSPASVVGGNPVRGTVKLECKAGPGPITVELQSNNTSLAYPVAPNVVVPQGTQTAPFDIVTMPVLSKTSVWFEGMANGNAKYRELTITSAAKVSPTSLKFGSVLVGTTSAMANATLDNLGAVSYAVGGIAITGINAVYYAQVNDCPANLPAGGSCTISVTFSPLVTGTRAAKLSISTSATTVPLTVSLTGSGVVLP